jgi:hypothetical protein
MAFQTSSPAPTTNVTKGDFKKADFFLNLTITDAVGNVSKLGFIGLHNDVASEKAIIDYLIANPGKEGDVIGAMTGEFRSGVAAAKPFAGFTFGKKAA